MSRKHFVAAAESLRAIASLSARRAAAERHAALFAASNPAFNRARFFAACGL